jgi:hypothetical protein
MATKPHYHPVLRRRPDPGLCHPARAAHHMQTTGIVSSIPTRIGTRRNRTPPPIAYRRRPWIMPPHLWIAAFARRRPDSGEARHPRAGSPHGDGSAVAGHRAANRRSLGSSRRCRPTSSSPCWLEPYSRAPHRTRHHRSIAALSRRDHRPSRAGKPAPNADEKEHRSGPVRTGRPRRPGVGSVAATIGAGRGSVMAGASRPFPLPANGRIKPWKPTRRSCSHFWM